MTMIGVVTFGMKAITSLMAAPGAIMIASALGLMNPPAEMRLGDKLATIGVQFPSTIATAILLAVGSGKAFIPINHFVLGGTFNALYAIASIPGFGLVLYSHLKITNPDPLIKEVPVVASPLIFCLIWALGGKPKADGQKKTK